MSVSTAALVLVLSPAPVPAVIALDEVAPAIQATQGAVLPGADVQGAPAPAPLPQSDTAASPPAPTGPVLPQPNTGVPPAPTGPALPQPEPVAPPPATTDPALPPPENPTAEAASPEATGGEIVVTAREEVPGDPLSEVNAESYEVVQAADKALVQPIASAYEEIVPDPLRDAIRNFLRNLEEPVIAFNYLLQLKPHRAVKSLVRFTVNSTIGVAGLIDVAKEKPLNLPYTPNGFGNTFACYGIGPGAYLYLPLIGPTTVRDLIGVTLDRAALPAVVGAPLNKPEYALPTSTVDALNDRIEIDGQITKIREESGDPYAATRDLYLAQREAEIAAICPKEGEVVDETLPPRPGKGRD